MEGRGLRRRGEEGREEEGRRRKGGGWEEDEGRGEGRREGGGVEEGSERSELYTAIIVGTTLLWKQHTSPLLDCTIILSYENTPHNAKAQTRPILPLWENCKTFGLVAQHSTSIHIHVYQKQSCHNFLIIQTAGNIQTKYGHSAFFQTGCHKHHS